MKLCCSIGMKPIRVTDELLSSLNSIKETEHGRFNIFDIAQNSKLIKTSFWTAATRQGCAGHYRFCMHDDVGPWDSQDSFWETVNPRDSGSCLVVDRQYAKEGAPFGVRQVQCSLPIANFACQKDNTIFFDLVNSVEYTYSSGPTIKYVDACDFPICSDQPFCSSGVPNPAKYENGERVLLKLSMFEGKWKTSCGVRYFIYDYIVTWSEAINLCCTMGMRLVSVQSYEKLVCLGSFLEENTGYWTSGTNSGCKNNRFRWCSTEFKDFIKQNENFNESLPANLYQSGGINKYCVKVQNLKMGEAILKVENCYERMNVICECFATCLAELLELMYDGSKFWEERIEKLLSTQKTSQVYEDFRSISNKFSLSLLKKGADNLDTLKMIKNEQNKEQAWKSTLFVNEALDRFRECNQKMKVYNSKGDECSFIHEFIKCFTNGSALLDKFWNKNWHDKFDPRDYSQMVAVNDYLTVKYGVQNSPDSNLRRFAYVVNKISFAEEVISSHCTYKYLKPKNLTLEDACLSREKYFIPTPVENVFMYNIVDKEKRYPPLVAASKCARANGSLVTVTESNIASMKILNNFLRNATKSESGSVLLDETYMISGNVTRWCSTSEELPMNSTEDRKLIKTSFWTAATRQGCAGHYRFCLHDDMGPWDSQDSFWDMVNPRDTGSCLVVDRQYTNVGALFGVRQVQCSVPIANFACQKDGKRMTDLVTLEKNANMEVVKYGYDLYKIYFLI
ncbi:Hypothetical predicted protein [Cloeon dipterum]|uniref:C-type lectin domain-containing protein n=1 Tax=Cloeon dipterum TaxID=197152 RepID=A0A8S1DFD3_9INSE|nr:Hypothetical predicted protein [Cloeon dipterum]